MITTVYLMRHSKSMKVKEDDSKEESLQIRNEKTVLSVLGEERAKEYSELNELSNVDVVISSNYSRAVGTAKYISEKCNVDIIINSNFGERKFGINSFSELPADFYIRQYSEQDYKINDGESQKDVQNRMYSELIRVLNNYSGKRIFIVSHSTAISFLIKKWCNVEMIDNKVLINYDNKDIFYDTIKSPELFKLEFDENNNLISIKNIVM